MTEKTTKAFQELYSKVVDYKHSQYKIQDIFEGPMRQVVQEKYRDSAQRAVLNALKPFHEEEEREIYKAAKIFVAVYESNELGK